jgi:predicted GH43/DUF377 family glycosyl hydrolase
MKDRMPPFQLTRLGVVMKPLPDDPYEAWGVLNPASARKDGRLYLYPRDVAEGNYSRIGIARVEFDGAGNPAGVERMGYALEPETEYERSARGTGGVEDPRVTWIEPLQIWVMAYTAVARWGPRIALAVSHDLFHWERLGLLTYDPTCDTDFSVYGNKDGAFFPDVVTDPQGKPALALLHRPTYLVAHPEGTVTLEVPCDARDERESIWIGYVSLERAQEDIHHLTHVYQSELLATPEFQWESLKIGGGTPPVLTPEGWLMFYHGVSGTYSLNPDVPKHVIYSAGVMVMDRHRPTQIIYRSPEPVLRPMGEDEEEGIVRNVVFPTAIDQREHGRLDVYYGMADSRIGVACTETPPQLPQNEKDQ